MNLGLLQQLVTFTKLAKTRSWKLKVFAIARIMESVLFIVRGLRARKTIYRHITRMLVIHWHRDHHCYQAGDRVESLPNFHFY